MSERAHELAQEAMALMAQGDMEGALATGEHAVGLLRPLVDEDPATHGAVLASVLQFQGVRNSILGRPEAALPFCRDALALRRTLAAEHPEAFPPIELAEGLNDACVLMSALGQAEEAVDLSEEAVTAFEAADAGPDALMMVLGNLALRRTAVGRHEQAKEACDAALAQLGAGGDRPDHALRLAGIRGTVLTAAGETDAAASVLRDALESALPAVRDDAQALAPLAGMLLEDLEQLGAVADAPWVTELRSLLSGDGA